MATGIYLITCAATGDRYVGASRNIDLRWQNHGSSLRLGKHPNPSLQRLYDLHGFESLKFQILEECTVNDLPGKEKSWHKELSPSLSDERYIYYLPSVPRQSMVSLSVAIPEFVKDELAQEGKPSGLTANKVAASILGEWYKLRQAQKDGRAESSAS